MRRLLREDFAMRRNGLWNEKLNVLGAPSLHFKRIRPVMSTKEKQKLRHCIS